MRLNQFRAIVIGGGHAGIEAANAIARTGINTLMVTHTFDTIGQMSCNPAIGGIGKSHLAKEVDAMGGLMAKAADLSGIHFRVLNASKGQAVRATRVQTDRYMYKTAIQKFIKKQKNLTTLEATVSDLMIEGLRVKGVVTEEHGSISAETVVITTGTFLGGVMHRGLKQQSGGRAGSKASNKLADRLRELPLEVGRLKTGTPPRIDGRSIDWKKATEQPGDTPRPVMSFNGNRREHPEQINCYITRTNPRTHEIISNSLDKSPLYSGKIKGAGPRYCPSIEDKVVRYPSKESHQIFLEPEGLTTNTIYPNGISTSLPEDSQECFVKSIRGLEGAKITEWGYAIEYDFFNPKGLKHSLESKHIEGLYFAGQINGTTGYEEAAAQGLLAGINASQKIKQKEEWVPGRDQAYLGVLVDDLVTQGTKEPYRMFTSRAEHRLLLREDNADLRLGKSALDIGLITTERWMEIKQKRHETTEEIKKLKHLKVRAGSEEANTLELITKQSITETKTHYELLKRPGINFTDLPESNKDLSQNYIDEIEAEVKYSGYIVRQQKEIKKNQKKEKTPIPKDINFKKIKGLSNEVVEKLNKHKPSTIGRALRISGITPAAISLLIIHLKKTKTNPKEAA